MTMLAEQVEVVIGVDTHKRHAHRGGRDRGDGCRVDRR